MNDWLEILKYILPALVVFFTVYLVIRSFFKNETKKLEFQMKSGYRKELLPLRLQAYERLTVFLERISPNNLIPRSTKKGMSAKGLQQALIRNIRMEFEHNISQQVYVSIRVWNAVCLSKDQIIKDINLISAQAPPNATASDLGKRILHYYLESDQVIPTRKAIELIKSEVNQLY